MTEIRNEQITKFYKKYKDKYPNLTEKEIHGIINGTFDYFRKKMNLEFCDLRIKRLGSFQIFAAAIVKEMKQMNYRIKKYNLSKEHYYSIRLKTLEKYVEENKELFDRYYERKKKHS